MEFFSFLSSLSEDEQKNDQRVYSKIQHLLTNSNSTSDLVKA